MQVTNIKFSKLNKLNTLDEYKSQDEFYFEDVEIKKTIYASDKLYDEMSGNFLSNQILYQKIGGRDYSGNNKRILELISNLEISYPDNYFVAYTKFTKALQDEGLYDEWVKNQTTNAVLVVRKNNPDFNDCFLVNTEGYGYARYVGFPSDAETNAGEFII